MSARLAPRSPSTIALKWITLSHAIFGTGDSAARPVEDAACLERSMAAI
jgi:hypothetical protein